MYQTHTPLSGQPFIPLVEDDTEEAPWMVMGDAQCALLEQRKVDE